MKAGKKYSSINQAVSPLFLSSLLYPDLFADFIQRIMTSFP